MNVLSGLGLQTSCSICGGYLNKVKLTHFLPDRFESHVGISSDDYRRDWIQCDLCGSCTNVMDPSNASSLARLADGYYEVDFASSTIAEKFSKVMALPEAISDNFGRVNRVSDRLDRWRETVTLCVSDIKILDIGAGTGVFLSKFQQVRSDRDETLLAFALEPDHIAAAHLRNLGTFEVIESVLDTAVVGSGYSLVTVNKVIEHVADPVSFLKEVSTIIDPTLGLIYLEVPDVATIDHRPASDNILGALHHHLYTMKGLISLFESAELEVLDINRIVEPSGKITVYGFACNGSAFDQYCAKGDLK